MGGGAVHGRGKGGRGAGGGAAGPPATKAEEEALEDLAKQAAAAGEAKKKDSGAGAVGLSRDTLGLKGFSGDKDDATGSGDRARAKLLRTLADRTFTSRGGVWFDLAVDLTKTRRRVEAFSDDYFALVKAHPEIAPALVLGNLVLALGDEVVEVFTPQ